MAIPTLEEYKAARRQGLTPEQAFSGNKTTTQPNVVSEQPKGLVQSVAQGIVSPFAKFGVTAYNANKGVLGAGAAAIKYATGDKRGALNTLNAASTPTNLDLGYFGQYQPIGENKPSIWEEKGFNKLTKTGIPEAVGTGLELGSYGTGLATAGVKGITGKAIATRIGAGGLMGAEAGAGSAMSQGESGKVIAQRALTGAAVGLATSGIFEGLGALWRKVGATEAIKERAGDVYNKELQPTIRDVEKDVRSGFKDLGRQISEVTDTNGNPTYVSRLKGTEGLNKGYRSLLNTAKEEIKTNSKSLRTALSQYDDVVTKKDIAGDIIKQMEDEYGVLKPSQIKQIKFEISRMPNKMDLNGVLDTKQMYDNLIPDSFWSKLDDPAVAFPSRVKYILRDNARKVINEKTADKTIQQLNNETSLAFDVKKLASHQISERKLFKVSETGKSFYMGIGRKIGQIIDDTIGNPLITTKYAQALRGMGQKVGQTPLRQVGRIFTTQLGQGITKRFSK